MSLPKVCFLYEAEDCLYYFIRVDVVNVQEYFQKSHFSMDRQRGKIKKVFESEIHMDSLSEMKLLDE